MITGVHDGGRKKRSERCLFNQRIKVDKLEKDTLCCEICGWTIYNNQTSVNVHHVVPAKYGGENTEENSLMLCPNHHAIAHYVTKMIYPKERIKNLTKETLIHKIRVQDEYEKTPLYYDNLSQIRMAEIMEKILYGRGVKAK